jgi:hypothetical protein
MVQSVLIPRSKYTLAQARAWLKGHKFRAGKVDITDTYYRFRQREPGKFKRFRTKSLSGGVKLILGY